MQVRETATTYPSQKKTYTYEDYLKLPDDRNRYEIINGELVKTPAPKTIHQGAISNLFYELKDFVRKNSLGKVYTSPCDVLLGDENIVQPDILFIAKENKKIITEDNIKGSPDLIIEILSPTTAYYDLIEKKELYEKFGIREYWIVDPKKHWIEVYTLKNEKYELFQREEKLERKIKSNLLEGFELRLKEIFKEEG